jgi:hypothetical protein
MQNKRAQILGQIFIFIIAGVVLILIMSYGYKAINYFIEKQEQVVMIDYKNDLETAIESVKRDYGTIRKITLSLPSKYQGACFVDYKNCPTDTPTLELPSQEIYAPWAQEACKIQSANAFTIPRTQDISLPDIEIDEGYLCIPNTGGITIKMEGTGKKAKISEWK